MNAQALVLVVALAAPAAFAQTYHSATPAYAPAPTHQAAPAYGAQPQYVAGGRWELRSTQQWVDGGYTQVWVNDCHGGRYVTQALPGRYETRQEWVWVRDARYNGYAYERRDDDRDYRGNGHRHGRGHGNWR